MRSSCPTDRVEIINCMKNPVQEDLAADVLKGLNATQKYLPSKYFYDSRGSALFEQICRLPEYYQTRTELSILRPAAAAIMGKMRDGAVIELGSGANSKVSILLDAANGSLSRIRYIPVDVCESMLKQEAVELASRYPELTVTGVVGDLTRNLNSIAAQGDKLILFFGSTIGNLQDDESSSFLEKIRLMLGPRDRLLIGLDLVKEKDILEAAYNDGRGVTAAFNRNILTVMNRELHASFDEQAFDHVAFYNEEQRRIEMHLRASRNMNVRIRKLAHDMTMRAGETIHTEISRKFTRKAVAMMAERAGLNVSRWYTDDREWFALVEMVR